MGVLCRNIAVVAGFAISCARRHAQRTKHGAATNREFAGSSSNNAGQFASIPRFIQLPVPRSARTTDGPYDAARVVNAQWQSLLVAARRNYVGH